MHHRRCIPLLLWASLLAAGCNTADNSKLFTRLDKEKTGIDFQNTLYDGESLNVLNYIYFYNGGGVAVGDINNDGLPDILFTGNMVHNRLFLNKGNFTFEDITEKSGIAAAQGWCTGATMVDINGDGRLDIYICRSADANPARRTNLLYINNGDGTFTEKAHEYGLDDAGFSTQAAFFDYDKDGDLDLFLINHSLHEYTTRAADNPDWRRESQPAFECKLYRNTWDENLHHPVFIDVTKEAGIRSDVLTFGLGLAISDINNDGWPDVYVSNDFNEPDYLFINNGNGTFTEKLASAMDQVPLYSMGNDFADFNNDGLVDLMTLDMLPADNHAQKMHSGAENFDKFQTLFDSGFYYQYSRNMLQKNNGDGTFSEIGELAGVSHTGWSWSALFADFDNDGNKDLFISNGYVRDYTDMDFLRYSADKALHDKAANPDQAVKDAISNMPPGAGTSYLFRNNGNGTFTRANKDWGIDQQTVSNGAAYVDLDNDGALDLVVNNTNDYAGIYRNNVRRLTKSHYLKVALLGDPRNGTGIGSKVKLFCGDTLYYQEAFPVRGFQSSVDPVLNFGTGDHTSIDSVLVIWPDDRYQVLKNIPADTTLKLRIKDATGRWDYQSSHARPFLTASDRPFLTASVKPGPLHKENTYNDFDHSPLLLNYLSRRGPCLAKTGDVKDGSGYVFFGGARGYSAQLFRITPSGDLQPSHQPAIEKDSLQDDGAALFFDANGDGQPDLLVGAGGYELPENDPHLQLRLYLNDGKGHFSKAENALPDLLLNTGCIKAADVDGDGDLDLFIGGRVTPGKYPLSPGSRLLLNDGKGHFTDATARLAPGLATLGMVTDAVWIDLDKDHHPDLVVVGEWMPIKVFLNKNGQLQDASDRYIHFPSSGWWNRIAVADLDGDGNPDVVLGNQGFNNPFGSSAQEPMRLYYKDFDHNGTIDPIFCYDIQDTSYPAISRDDLIDAMPMLKKRFPDYHSYADATIRDIFTPEELKDAGVLRCETLATCWLQNKGDSGFVQRPLPMEAQYGPVYAITTADIDGDGHPDLLLAGGNQWTRIRFGRFRANHGILLLNDGHGNFRYVPQDRSGLQLRGDIRDALDLGNKKLLFGINDAPAQVYAY
jgi:enediyne biosynthesis protein E4